MTSNDKSGAIDGAALGRSIVTIALADAKACAAGVRIAAPDARPLTEASTNVTV